MQTLLHTEQNDFGEHHTEDTVGALVYITGWCSAQETTGPSFAVSTFPGPQVPAMSLPAARFM